MNTDTTGLLASLFDGVERVSIEELNPISEKIIGCAYQVGNTLGCGFLEKVYENALAHELRKNGLSAVQQQEIRVMYDGIAVGKYETDILVEGTVIVEVKAVRDMNEVFKAQCLNYLRATGYRLCLLINFGTPRVQIKRIVL